MSNDMEFAPYLANDTITNAMTVLKLTSDWKMAIRLTTHSGTKYLIALDDEAGCFKAARRGAEEGDEHMGTAWFPIADKVEPLNIWGSIKLGHWETTAVVKVELVTSVRKGGQSITVFER